MPKITFLAGEGCLSSSITGLMDAFHIANMWHEAIARRSEPLFRSEIVTTDGKSVICDGCIQIHAHTSIDDFDRTDFLMVPPFIPVTSPMTHNMDRILDFIVDQHHARTPIAAMCTGVFLLAETGLLDGRTATTNWQFVKMFRRRYPKVNLKPEHILTEDNGLICSGAATSIYNLGIYVIERFGSDELAALCSKALLVDPNRNSQAPYIVHHDRKDHGDADIIRAQNYMEDNYEKNIAMDEVAKLACLSPRHFKRRFKQATGEPPLTYLQKIRIEAAKKRLETTMDSINEITWQIGYEDSSTFRRLFKKHTDLSPRRYRDKFFRVRNEHIE
jgi:transcriptional regulator GlxA family with amidase domain